MTFFLLKIVWHSVVMTSSTWLILLHLSVFDIANGNTHWIVTEDGRIQAQVDSIFNVQCPYDVMVLLKQEQRREMAESIRTELLLQNTMETVEEKDTDFEKEFYTKEPTCITAGKPLIEFDLYTSSVLTLETKGMWTEDYMPSLRFENHRTSPGKDPTCSSYVPLDFSMHAFEHLQGMVERHNMTSGPEFDLRGVVPHADDVEKFGSFVASELEKNETSWVYYNLATYFWRVKGDSLQAVECIRRSLHFSPREYKDVALVSLSNILHKNHRSKDAAIILHAALDISNIFSEEHFALGNIYAVLGDFNKSVICYENALRLNKDFFEAKLRRKAILCHLKLESLLEAKHRSLQKTLDDLKKYQQQHEVWQVLHKKMTSEKLRSDERIKQNNFYEAHIKMVKELHREPQFSSLSLHLLSGKRLFKDSGLSFLNWNKFDTAGNTAKLSNTTSGSKGMPSRGSNEGSNKHRNSGNKKKPQGGPHDFTPFLRRHLREQSPNFVDNLFSGKLRDFNSQSTKADLPYMSGDWPTEGECSRNVRHFPTWNEFQTVFLSLDNKGLENSIAHILGEGQGLEEGQAHPFPWYPPVCAPSPSSSSSSDIPEGPNTYDHISAVRDRASLRVKLEDSAMKEVLIPQVVEDLKSEITIEEIGQRILTALKNKIGPPWVLYNMAGLFWRIVGNPLNSIECIRRALHYVPHNFRDVPTVNLACVLYKIGRVNDAVRVMKDALAINNYEPNSLFFMGNLLASLGNVTGAVSYYQEALGLDPTHDATLKNLRMVLCFKKFHLNHQTLATPSLSSTTPATGDNEQNGNIENGNNKNNNVIMSHKRHPDGPKGLFTLAKVCSKEVNDRRVPFRLYAPQGEGRFCAIPISEHKIYEESVNFFAHKDDCQLRDSREDPVNIDKTENCHRVPANIIHSTNDAPCESEFLRTHHHHQHHQQQQIYYSDSDDK